MSKKEERQIEEKVFRQTAQDEIKKIINPPEENEAPIILTAKERQKAELERQQEIARRKNLNKLNEKRQMEEEYMGAVASKKNAKARKVAYHRHRKNFGWWIFGFFSFILIICIAVGVVFAVIPIKTYLGDESDKYVNDEIADSTPLQIIQNITNYKAGDVPAVELLFDILLEDYELNKFISVDIDRINKATLVSSEFTEALSEGIKIIATIRSLELDDSLGELGNTSAFKEFEKIPKDKLPDFSKEDFNEKLYYYKLDDGSYTRAFDDDGKRIEGSEGKDLYLPALVDVMILDVPAIMTDRLEAMRVSELLNCFGMDESNTFSQIIEDRTIGEMKDFDINTVKLSVVFPIDDNETLKNTLIDMTYQSVYDSYVDKKACEEFLKEEANKEKTKEDWEKFSEEEKDSYIDGLIEKKLCQRYLQDNVGKTEEDWNSLSAEDKNAYKDELICTYYLSLYTDKTKEDWDNLSEKEKREYYIKDTFEFPRESNDQYNLITIGDLENADMNKVRLTSVMKETEDNKKMFDILVDMSGKVRSDLTVGDMANADVSQIKISSVMPETDDNRKLFNILEDMTRNNVLDDMASEIYLLENPDKSIEDWDSFSEKEKMPYLTQAKKDYNDLPMKKYLIENEGKTEEDWNNLSEAEKEPYIRYAKHDLIRVVHLGNGDVTHIRLVSILDRDKNERLYEVLRDLSSKNVIEQFIFDNYENITREEWQGKPDDYVMADGRTRGELWNEASARYFGIDNYINTNFKSEEREDKKNEIILNYINYKYDLNLTDISHLTPEQIADEEDFFKGFNNEERNQLITIASLDEGDITLIKLTSVLSPTGNERLYDIIRDMTHRDNNDEIMVKDLENADIKHIKLINVLPIGDDENPTKNEKLYNVLRDLSYENVIDQYRYDHNNCDRDIAVEYYNGLTKEEKNELITVASLDGSNINDIKLESVIPEKPDNKILAKLWEDKTVTVGNMTEKLDDLPVGHVYEKEVFTKNSNNAVDGGRYLMEEVDGKKVYTLDASGDYYISKEASVWLVMLYNCNGFDSTDGYGSKYTENLKTFSEMEGSIGDISSAIKGCSIRQLVEMGIIDDNPSSFSDKYNKTLSMVLSGN